MPDRPPAAGTGLPDGTTSTRQAAVVAQRSRAAVQPSRVRGQVVDRLVLACRRHIRHAVARRWTRQPIGPHAIMFFYSEPATAGPAGLRIASRLFLDGDDVSDLATVLTQLRDLSASYAESGGLDPRHQLSTHVENMTSAARYIGTGVSTLHHAPTPPPAPRGGGPADPSTPGDTSLRGIADLVDGTRAVIRARGTLQPLQIQSTHTLDVGPTPMRIWRWAQSDFRHDEDGLATASQALSELHALIAGSSHHRSPPGQRRAGQRT